jgi:hypothetical protein
MARRSARVLCRQRSPCDFASVRCYLRIAPPLRTTRVAVPCTIHDNTALITSRMSRTWLIAACYQGKLFKNMAKTEVCKIVGREIAQWGERCIWASMSSRRRWINCRTTHFIATLTAIMANTRSRDSFAANQYLCMSFVQLAHRERLRDLDACLCPQSSPPLLGYSRTTSCAIGAARDPRIYCDLAQRLQSSNPPPATSMPRMGVIARLAGSCMQHDASEHELV